MTRVGVLGLEPFLVSQVEGLDPNLEVVLMDAVDDEARQDLDLGVVLVSSEHAAAPRLIGAHPTPPVVVVAEPSSRSESTEPAPPGAPVRLVRPVSSPDLLEAIDSSRGVSRLRRSLRAMTIEQDDAAIADRWAALARTAAVLVALWWAVANVTVVGLSVVVLLTAFAIGRSLWWRLTTWMVLVDAVLVVAVVAGISRNTGDPTFALTILTTAIALEAGFVAGLWRAMVGATVFLALLSGLWLVGLGRSLGDLVEASNSAALLLVAVAAGGMARRLWLDRTRSRSSELRQFRSALYDLSRRQAVVSVSFDIGTVAHDALTRVIADVRPRSAMVLVADGPGPLQVAASHNLPSPPPVRLTWQAGTHEASRALATPTPVGSTTIAAPPATSAPVATEPQVTVAPATGDVAGRDALPDWRPSTAHETQDRDRVEGAGSAMPDEPAPDDPSDPADEPAASAPAGSSEVIDDRASTGDEQDLTVGDGDHATTDRSADGGPADLADEPAHPAGPAGAGPAIPGARRARDAARWAGRGQDGATLDRPITDPNTPPDASTPTSSVAPTVPASMDPEPMATDGAEHATDGEPGPGTSLTAALLRRMQEAQHGVDVNDVGGARFDGNAASTDDGHRVDEHAPVSALERRARQRGRRKADPDEQRVMADLLQRTTIEATHQARLTSVLEQLAPLLPTGAVLVQGAELDGELMGALIVVDAAEPRSVPRHAEETALALDSVRLFNRLRAFTRDQERARIGRSLHDGVMQTLAHVAFELDRVSNESWDESQVEHLGQLRDHVLGTVDEMRAVVNDLRTVRLDRGLSAALEAMALTLSPAGGPVIEVTTSDVGSLPGDVEEQFLRIAEEALTNAVRHSGARNVRLTLNRADGALVLQVSDDGFGFTQSRVGATDGGVGLTSMYQRSKSIGAGLDIDTGATGTIVTVHQPLTSTAVTVATPPEPARASGRRRASRRVRRGR